MSCGEIDRLIVREAEDRLGADERARLEAHLARCAACRAELEAQRAVRRLLRSRGAAPVPAGFEERLRARLEGLGGVWGLPALAWRRYTIGVAPVAAALVMLVVLSLSGTPSGASSLWEETTASGAPASAIVWESDLSDEEMFVALLRARSDETLQEFFQKQGQ